LFSRALGKIRKNDMINTSFYTGIGTMIGYISGFVVQKVIATYLGPSGLAIVSQFQNYINITTALATGGIQQGIVKYVAEVREDEVKKSLVISTSLSITLICVVFVSAFNIISYRWIGRLLFNEDQYSIVILLFGGTVLLFSLNNLLISIMNGIGEIKKLVLVKISTNIVSLLFTTALSILYGIKGALISLATSNSIVLLVTVIFVLRSKWFNIEVINKKINKEYSLKLINYSIMALFSMILVPFVQIGIRNYIIENVSIEDAGYWDGLWKISSAYLGIITTTLGIYYLPKLSTLSCRNDIRKELINGYKIITPILIVIISLVYLFRDNIIILLYSRDFMSMSYLFAPQLLGDFFKIMSWLLAYLMLAKAKTFLFVTTQLLFSSITYFLSIYMIDVYGIDGVVWAHTIKYFIYSLTMVYIFRRYIIS
jgi:polysaccharide transporter, PST family